MEAKHESPSTLTDFVAATFTKASRGVRYFGLHSAGPVPLERTVVQVMIPPARFNPFWVVKCNFLRPADVCTMGSCVSHTGSKDMLGLK